MATEPQPQLPTEASVTKPDIELTINAKPPTDVTNTHEPSCNCAHPNPTLKRNDTNASFVSNDFNFDDEYIAPRSRPRRRGNNLRRFSPSPVQIRSRPPPDTIFLPSSTKLLSQVGSYDGVADLPYPGRSSVYLTTFPFTEKDVKKYSWLFAHAIEDVFLLEPNKNLSDEVDEYTGYPVVIQNQHLRSRSPYYNDSIINNDIPAIFLSCALDTSVVPENSEHTVRYWIVVQNKSRPQGTKMIVAESRKAAGILMYYEALTGNSVVFVGAVVKSETDEKERGVKRRVKVKRVETLEEAVEVQKEKGVVGIVC